MSPDSLRRAGLLLFLAGIVLVAIGIVYFTVPVDHLPSILGRIPGESGHHTSRALFAVVVGILCWIVSPVMLRRAVIRRRAMRFARYR